MAHLQNIWCSECQQQKSVWVGANRLPPRICPECGTTKEQTQKEKHLAELASLPLKERIRRIEEWIYDHPRAMNHSREAIWSSPIGSNRP